jgi:glycosyltransferase involved in cell wall biosynthesis
MTISSNLSVVIPAHQAQATLAKAIGSALSVANPENVIVVCDSCTDLTLRIAESAGVRTVPCNFSSAFKSRELGLASVETNYVVFLDSDDTLIASGPLLLITSLEANTSSVAAAGIVRFMNKSGVEWFSKLDRAKITFESALVRGIPPAPPGGIVYRSEVVRHALSSSPPYLGLGYADDYELMLRVLAFGDMDTVAEKALNYSVGLGKSSRNVVQALADAETIRRYYAENFSFRVTHRSPRTLRSLALFRIGYEKRSRLNLLRLTYSFAAVILEPGFFLDRLFSRIRGEKLS